MTRTHLMLVVVLVLLAAGPGFASADTPEPVTTVILVRHAEKTAEANDPGLTEAGEARAWALASMLRATPLQALYATPFRRTRDTLKPLAAMLGMEIRELPLDRSRLDEHGRDTAALIAERHPGETILISGHSNTVPMIIEALGAEPVPVIDETVYGDVFVVTLAGERALLLRMRFGD